MTGANTPAPATSDLGLLGPATLHAIRTGVRACDRDLEIYAALEQRRKLTRREVIDRAAAQQSRELLLTQPYPLPYDQGREIGAEDRGSQPAEPNPPS